MDQLYRMFRFRTVGLNRSTILPASRLSAALLLCLSVVNGCSREDARTASPRAAAKAYVTAMNAGDADTLAAVTQGDAEALKLLTSVARSNAAYARLQTISGQKFGNPDAVFAYPRRGKDHYAEMQKDIDAAQEKVEGNAATIGQGLASVYLTKVDGRWKVDLDRHVPKQSITPSAIALPDALAAAYTEVADQLAAGGYESADAAKADLMGKTQKAVLSQMETDVPTEATPRGTTQPTTMQTGMNDGR